MYVYDSSAPTWVLQPSSRRRFDSPCWKGPSLEPIICFSSDFGVSDTWVGVCHAAIHRVCPAAMVVDLGHDTAPYDIRAGAVLAASGAHQLADAIHLVVVDPGVGGLRRDICIVARTGTRLVGPDNGVLMPAATRAGGVAMVYAIDSAAVGSGAPLPTFHARDVLAPAAAAMACGAEPSSLGERIDPASLAPPPFPPARQEGEYVLGEVLAADRFGSLRTSISLEDLERFGLDSPELEFSIGHVALTLPLASTFADVGPGELVALVDSSGWLTLAENKGSAEERLGLEPGANVRVRATR